MSFVTFFTEEAAELENELERRTVHIIDLFTCILFRIFIVSER